MTKKKISTKSTKEEFLEELELAKELETALREKINRLVEEKRTFLRERAEEAQMVEKLRNERDSLREVIVHKGDELFHYQEELQEVYTLLGRVLHQYSKRNNNLNLSGRRKEEPQLRAFKK